MYHLSVRFWDLTTETPLHEGKGVHTQYVLALAWAPDGNKLASGDKNGHVAIWDPEKGTQIGKKLLGHKQFITALAWQPLHLTTDGNRVLIFLCSFFLFMSPCSRYSSQVVQLLQGRRRPRVGRAQPALPPLPHLPHDERHLPQVGRNGPHLLGFSGQNDQGKTFILLHVMAAIQ